MRDSLNSRLKFIFSLFVILACVVAMFWFGAQWKGQNTDMKTDTFMNTMPSGLLVMSYAGLVYNGQAVRMLPAVYDFAASGLFYVPVDQLQGTTDDTNIAYQHSFSPSGNYVAFVASTRLKDFTAANIADLGQLPLNLYRAQVSDVANKEMLIRDMQAADMIEGITDATVQLPSVSDDGNIVVMAHAHGPAQDVFVNTDADEWDIYLVRNGGAVSRVASGVHPTWIDANRFVYIKNDGIYLYDVVESTDQILIRSDNDLNIQNHLDISHASQQLVWTDPVSGRVRLFDLVSIDREARLDLKHEFVEVAASAVFSPDGRWLAVRTLGVNADNQTEALNVIKIFDTATSAGVGSPIVFSGANVNLTYLTDWIQ